MEEEILQIQAIPGIDSFTGLYGLLLEASEIGDTNRFARLKKVLPNQLDFLIKLPECKYFHGDIKLVIENTWPEEVARSYPSGQFYGYGLPATWRSTETIDQLNSNSELIKLIESHEQMEDEND